MRTTLPLLALSLALACTNSETCTQNSDCDDQNACTEDVCNATSCENTAVSVEDGIACTNDSCDPAVGVLHEPVDSLCDDGVSCTNDSCSASLGCVQIPDDNLCSPGEICSATNDCQDGTPSNPTLTAVSPNNGLSIISTLDVEITGTDLQNNAQLSFAGVTVPSDNCDYSNIPTRIVCTVPSSANPTRGDVQLENPDGGSTSLSNAWTYTDIQNETNSDAEVDFCNLQFPTLTTVIQNQDSELIFGRIFHNGLTQQSGADPSILAELGIGPDLTSPLDNGSWRFFPAQFNTQIGNDDEYLATLKGPSVSSQTLFLYTYRMSLDGGLSYTYCDGDGAGSNGGLDFNTSGLGVMTVLP